MNFNIKKPWRNQNHRSPWNRELNQKKQTIVQDLTAGDGVRVERTSAGDVVFDQGMAVLPNDSRADDIYHELKARQKHPWHYNIVKDREGYKRDPTHKYRITNPGLPWAKYDSLGRRIKQ